MSKEHQILTELLMTETSRRNTDMIADLVFQKPELFPALMAIFFQNEEPISRRAVWVIDTLAEKVPQILEPYFERVILILPEFQHDGLKRNTLRMLSRADIPLNQCGMLIKTCFDWLISPAESVAVKVFAMDILYRFSRIEPDLKKELADSIEFRLAEETPGFRNHGEKILKRLYREMKGGFL